MRLVVEFFFLYNWALRYWDLRESKKSIKSSPDFREIVVVLKEGATPEIDVSYFRMAIYFDFVSYVFSVLPWEITLFGNCMLEVLLVTLAEKRS